jgi:membrane protease YdiL (CAAX protease family)
MVKMALSPDKDFGAAAAALESDGLFVGLAEVFAGSIALALTMLFTWLRRGPPIGVYLAWRTISWPAALRWLLAAAGLAALLDGMAALAGHPVVPPWVESVYRSAVFLPLLVFAFVVVAPLAEEVVVRGFLFEGLRHSRLGDAGTIVLSSLLWTSVHLQYEWLYLGQVFVVGLLLGAARARTGSLVPSIAMHALYNGIGTLQAALQS